MASVLTGLDRVAAGETERIAGIRVSLLCHPASVTHGLEHAASVLTRAGADIVSLLGPEHGIDAAAQDMEDVTSDSAASTPTYSLYGDAVSSLSPSPAMFHDASCLVCDLQDIGSRYYTYVWTAVLAAEVALGHGLDVVVLDRPNPLGGIDDWVEGGTIESGYESFVGLHPVSTRHGMTIAELVRLAIAERGKVDPRGLHVVECHGWRREMPFDETGLAWVLPSPNMPTFDTATVYPGQCLLEGTNLSEGRGTTRPFEIFGAPWIDGRALAGAVTPDERPGLDLRPLSFKPTFQKNAGAICGGAQLHVRAAREVRSLRTSWALLGAMWRQGGGATKWRTEPYEFVSDRLAIDLLAGGPWLREAIEAGVAAAELVRAQEHDRLTFIRRRRPFLLYG